MPKKAVSVFPKLVFGVAYNLALFTRLTLPVTQQKSLKMLTRSRHHLSHDAALPDQVAHGFVIGTRQGATLRPD
ncbi:MAG: hypothetical protein EOS57_01130 [Mesorhizobium sp.]|nr:MAG: hypothetical protein EOS57_01130 [Mesorhizobium sp.]